MDFERVQSAFLLDKKGKVSLCKDPKTGDGKEKEKEKKKRKKGTGTVQYRNSGSLGARFFTQAQCLRSERQRQNIHYLLIAPSNY